MMEHNSAQSAAKQRACFRRTTHNLSTHRSTSGAEPSAGFQRIACLSPHQGPRSPSEIATRDPQAR